MVSPITHEEPHFNIGVGGAKSCLCFCALCAPPRSYACICSDCTCRDETTHDHHDAAKPEGEEPDAPPFTD